MDNQKIESIARNLVIVAESCAIATKKLRDALAAFEEAAIREALARIEEYEKCDPMDELLQAMRNIEEQLLMEELAEDPADIEIPRKAPRPPKRIGPVNKVNYTDNRPRRMARSCLRSMRR